MFNPGQQIRINSGPYAGLLGTFDGKTIDGIMITLRSQPGQEKRRVCVQFGEIEVAA